MVYETTTLYYLSVFMKVVILIGILFQIMISQLMFAQENVANKSDVINGLRELIEENQQYHYKAQMLFKEVGADSFEVRNFIISYRYNSENFLYGYDYEIAEILSDGSIMNVMAIAKSMFMIHDGYREIMEQDLPKQIVIGNYFETIRNYFIWPDLFKPIFDVDENKIDYREEADSLYLDIEVSKRSNTQLILKKNSFLPLIYTNTIRLDDLNLDQILEIRFSYDGEINLLPDSAFSPSYYISQGFTHQYLDHDSMQTQISGSDTLSGIKIETLLNYPFVDSDDDTIYLKNLKDSYILLDFWFAACLPCQKAFPALNQLAYQNQNKGLKVVGINCLDSHNKANLVKKLRSRNITIPFLFGSKDLTESLGISGFPSYYLISPGFNVTLLKGDISGIEEQINKLVNK